MQSPTAEQQTPKEVVALPWEKGPSSYEIWHEAKEEPDWIIGEIDLGISTLPIESGGGAAEPSVPRPQ